jgi:hypothetical protein
MQDIIFLKLVRYQVRTEVSDIGSSDDPYVIQLGPKGHQKSSSEQDLWTYLESF